jgi:hypothetical protein
MKYTLEKLQDMSPKERRNVLDNNLAKIDDPKVGQVARENVELIRSSGLKIAAPSELRLGDWQLREIEIIVNNPANEPAMLDSIAKGLPPLGAIERHIVEKLGSEYSSERRDTVHAGDLVAKRLYALNYEKIEGGEKSMPSGSVAKKAATFRKKPGAK